MKSAPVELKVLKVRNKYDMEKIDKDSGNDEGDNRCSKTIFQTNQPK